MIIYLFRGIVIINISADRKTNRRFLPGIIDLLFFLVLIIIIDKAGNNKNNDHYVFKNGGNQLREVRFL